MSATEELLRMVLAEQLRLRCDLIRAGVITEPRDAGDLLAAIVAAVGSRAFTARELVDHAEAVAGDLRNTLAEIETRTARGLGKALLRIEGESHGGLTVQRIGEERAGIIWTIRAG